MRQKNHRIRLFLGLLAWSALLLSGLGGLGSLTACMHVEAGESAPRASKTEVMPDTWVFTDGLGRVSLTNAEVGDPREDKTLAMFYWTWHVELAPKGAVNTTELMKKYPEAKNDYDHAAWQHSDRYCFWNEPIYGFYRTDDAWVLRRQAELLANAGVDVIFTDNTNGAYTWESSYQALLKEWNDAQRRGRVDTPKVSFLLPFESNHWSDYQVRVIYADLYERGQYKNLWFYWDGKPMLMGHGDTFLSDSASSYDAAIGDFFTWRGGQAGYGIKSTKTGEWGWLSTYPQAVYLAPNKDGGKRIPEQVPVGVAINHSYVTDEITAMNGEHVMGRSYTSDYPDRYLKEGAEASKWGYNFAEQFGRALKVDPKVIFVTGWNEWHASRQAVPWGGPNSKVNNALPDQFDDEHSRDIEPSKGALQDHYYYQLVNFARQYKGARPIPMPSENQTIRLNRSVEQWNTVKPYYAAYIGNTDNRKAQGYGNLRYTETSGRNDIAGAQVARDDEFIYFLVECVEDITPYTDNLWMNLYIDTDQANQGWNTFDYVVNKSPASKDTLVLEKFMRDDDYAAAKKVAEVAYTVSGKYLTVKIAKADLGLAGHDFTINFAWTDNVHDEGDKTKFSGDIMDFYISGDVAPGGRFKYSFISTHENAGVPREETATPDTASDDPTPPPATEEETARETLPSTGTAPTSPAETDIPNNNGCSSTVSGGAFGILVLLGWYRTRRREDT